MRKASLILTILLFSLGIQAQNYNVRDYGAKGDGSTLDHIAINKAIDACVAGGGGRVLLPAGTYLCGSIRLKSNVDLHLTAGAKVLVREVLFNAKEHSPPMHHCIIEAPRPLF